MCNCVKKIKTTGVAFQSNMVVYTIPSNVVLVPNQAYNIVFCQPLPNTATLGSTVIVTNGTTNYNVFTRKGDTLLTKYILDYCGIKTWFSANNTFILRNFIFLGNCSCDSNVVSNVARFFTEQAKTEVKKVSKEA